MDREAVHDCAPRGGCGRHGPGPVGGDGARAPSMEGAVALRAAAGAAAGSVHSAAHGGVCGGRRPGLAAQRLPRLFAAPVRAGFEHMRRGHGFALQ